MTTIKFGAFHPNTQRKFDEARQINADLKQVVLDNLTDLEYSLEKRNIQDDVITGLLGVIMRLLPADLLPRLYESIKKSKYVAPEKVGDDLFRRMHPEKSQERL